MQPNLNLPLQLTRRTFLARSGVNLGAVALASLLSRNQLRGQAPADSARPAVPRWSGVLSQPHHAPRVKRVIFLTMAGGPSHLETFDHKPELARLHGQPMPESLTRGQPIAQLQGARLVCFAPTDTFKGFGRSGHGLCEHLP